MGVFFNDGVHSMKVLWRYGDQRVGDTSASSSSSSSSARGRPTSRSLTRATSYATTPPPFRDVTSRDKRIRREDGITEEVAITENEVATEEVVENDRNDRWTGVLQYMDTISKHDCRVGHFVQQFSPGARAALLRRRDLMLPESDAAPSPVYASVLSQFLKKDFKEDVDSDVIIKFFMIAFEIKRQMALKS